MTALRERVVEAEITRMPVERSHITEMVIGAFGLVVAAVGAWMYYAPTNWFPGGLVEGWPFDLFIAAGILLTVAFGLFARMNYIDDPKWTTAVTVTSVLALAAFGDAIAFALIWIL